MRDPSIPLTDPVPGLPEYARSAGWTAELSGPQLDGSVAGFAHEMIMSLLGIPRMVDFTPVGGGPNRYADAFSGQVDGRAFIVSNVSFTVSHVHGGERPVAGSLCSVGLGCLLPLVFITPHGREPAMRAMTKSVKLDRDDFDKRFEIRSGHPDYAVALVRPMADELLRRDDWAFYLEFANLVSLAVAPFVTVEDITARLAAMSRLISLIPTSVREAYEVKLPPASTPDMITAQDHERAKQIIDALPVDQRRALFARIRSDGPEVVIRQLLDSNR